MNVAIVGNGPTAANHVAEIEAADCVVRINAWVPGFAGSRIDAWCSHFGDDVILAAMHHGSLLPSLRVPKWMAAPLGYSNRWRCDADPDINFRSLGGRDCDSMDPDTWLLATRELKGARPSTGFAAIALAQELMCSEGALGITLYGFDATRPTEPGWSSPCREWTANDPCAHPHDFALEKVLIAYAIKDASFLGRFISLHRV